MCTGLTVNGAGISAITAPTLTVAAYCVGTGITGANGGDFENVGTFDCTAAPRNAYGVYAGSFGTKSAGAFGLTNHAIYADASGGDLNYCFYGGSGTLHNTGPASFGSGVTIGNAAGDAHSLTGTLTANATTGADGDVITRVAGLPEWATPALYLFSIGFGHGGDGALVFDGTNPVVTELYTFTPVAGVYTIDKVIQAASMSIITNAILKICSVPVFCRGDITGDGTGIIHANGNPGSGTTGGATTTAGASGHGYLPRGTAGGNGGINELSTSSPGTTSSVGIDRYSSTAVAGVNAGAGGVGVNGNPGGRCHGGSGGTGGPNAANIGGASGVGGVITLTAVAPQWAHQMLNMLLARSVGGDAYTGPSGGSGGGGRITGGGGTIVGGGGGGGAGWVVIAAKSISGVTIQAIGGAGANGPGAGTGGGGGGGGGVVILVVARGPLPTPVVTGGAGGLKNAAPTPAGAGGVVGGDGGAGGDGYFLPGGGVILES